MLNQIFTAILEHLAPLEEQGLRVERFTGELTRPQARAQVTVGFRRTRASEPQQLNLDAPIVQSRRIEFELLLRLLDLRGHEDSFDAIGLIEERLIGFRPLDDIHCKRLYHVSTDFLGVTESIWGYSLVFALNYPFTKPVRGI